MRFKLDMVAMQETKCGGVKTNKTIKRLWFYKNLRIKACGFLIDIWLMRNIDDLQITFVKQNQHFLHVNISDGNKQNWLLIVVYASHRDMERMDT